MFEERGKHHDLVCIGCRNIVTGGRTPLQHDAVREKVVRDELMNLTFIRGGRLKQVWVQGGHSWEGVDAKARNRVERGDGDRGKEDEKWRRREK
jgi:hypothetical protein